MRKRKRSSMGQTSAFYQFPVYLAEEPPQRTYRWPVARPVLREGLLHLLQDRQDAIMDQGGRELPVTGNAQETKQDAQMVGQFRPSGKPVGLVGFLESYQEHTPPGSLAEGMVADVQRVRRRNVEGLRIEFLHRPGRLAPGKVRERLHGLGGAV